MGHQGQEATNGIEKWQFYPIWPAYQLLTDTTHFYGEVDR